MATATTAVGNDVRTPVLLITLAGALLLTACSQMVPKAPEPSAQHLRAESATPPGEAPEVVTTAPYVPPPQPGPRAEKYTLVVSEVPVQEVLFALARDAEVNVDIDPKVTGSVTLNAVDQTLPQILDRIARQTDIRWERRDGTIVVEPDTPYLRSYTVDYINMERDSEGTVKIATQIESALGEGGGSQSSNTSTTDLKGSSRNRFWASLVSNVSAILGEQIQISQSDRLPVTENVIPHPETGMLTVRATGKQHQQIQELIDSVIRNARRQVMIESTIVEVDLSDQYQTGIDWQLLLTQIAGIGVAANITPAIPNALFNPSADSPFTVTFQNSRDPTGANAADRGRRIQATINLLHEFGNVKVLSSPKLMVLNNQTALLKVAENIVYFTAKADTVQNQTNTLTTITTTPHTVPVGFVMTITPQISSNDQVILDVRPTISRKTTDVPDPNPNLAITSNIPQIAIKEMQSILNLENGQIAVLGGLMQEQTGNNKNQVPFLSRIPVLGDTLFTSNSQSVSKSELVIFLRPVIVRRPSLGGDLADYRPYLGDRVGTAQQ